MAKTAAVALLTLALAAGGWASSHGTHHRHVHARSAHARAAFKHQHPCPSTGRRSGACPGYVVDHRCPLRCGGADAPRNMQWQTAAEGKAKDRWEGNCALSCR